MIFFAPCAFLKPSQPKLKSAQTRASPNSSQPKPQSAQTRASPNSSQPKLKSAQTQVSPCGSKTSPDEEQRGQRELRAIWAIQLTAASGRELLLRHLRGTKIDWAALLAKYREERVCSGCSEKKTQQAYTGGQWKRLDRDRVCRECCQRHADAGRPWQCNRCKGWHAEINFPEKHRKRQCSFYRVCLSCEWTKPCYKCGRALPEAEFGSAAWKARNANRRVCRSCAAKVRGHWSCSVCQEQRPVKEFSAWKERHAYQQDGTQRCNDCLQEALVGAIAQRVKAKLARLRKRIKTEHQAAIMAKKKQRNAAILAEVRALIAAQSLQTCNQNAPTTPHNHAAAPTHLATPQTTSAATEPPKTTHAYTCPFCLGTAHSSVDTGRVDHRTQCGKQFRVQNGCVVGRVYHHQCPQCGATVQSTRNAGRIRIKRNTPQGRACSCQSWQV